MRVRELKNELELVGYALESSMRKQQLVDIVQAVRKFSNQIITGACEQTGSYYDDVNGMLVMPTNDPSVPPDGGSGDSPNAQGSADVQVDDAPPTQDYPETCHVCCQ